LFFNGYSNDAEKTLKIQIKPKKTNKTIENTHKPMISSNLRSPGLGRPTLISLGS